MVTHRVSVCTISIRIIIPVRKIAREIISVEEDRVPWGKPEGNNRPLSVL